MKLMTKWIATNGRHSRMNAEPGKQQYIVAYIEYVGPTYNYYTNGYHDDAYWYGTMFHDNRISPYYNHSDLDLLKALIDDDLCKNGWIEVPDKYRAML